MPSNLPPGVTDGMLPGNRPEDMEWERVHEWIDDVSVARGMDADDMRTVVYAGLGAWDAIHPYLQQLAEREKGMSVEVEPPDARAHLRDVRPLVGQRVSSPRTKRHGLDGLGGFVNALVDGNADDCPLWTSREEDRPPQEKGEE